ncbi:DUF2515 family protein [Bacillus sp. RO2]|jgi:hypothetical protein|uniref:DUF2515 family protein n=1 Tax=Bacillus sp. RO2 TaxID=2723913 RepID=UPI00145CE43D|nr:DUF2515 family protein [Bacillus sp. RO2]NMH74123.1 DUF2515 family protein [Bacillus sp. RO2]
MYVKNSTLYSVIKERRSTYKYSFQENNFITTIQKNTAKYNADNISRTKAYIDYYYRNKEIRWAFLASMVSRNAGWNMTDLEGKWFKLALDWRKRYPIFLTYELANWMIFHDAYPQLLLYELSKKYNKPLFHLLKEFHVSCFMEVEWQYFWEKRDIGRLMTSLIINEQNLIQEPVLQNKKLKRKVFGTSVYAFQDLGHFSCVIFPTLTGKLYGYSVHGFQKLHNRIDLGKRLADLLFDRAFFDSFLNFSQETEPTGSRYDYEQYLHNGLFRETPVLRAVYPVVPHQPFLQGDWVFRQAKHLSKWKERVSGERKEIEITKWFIHKQHQLHSLIAIKKWL